MLPGASANPSSRSPAIAWSPLLALLAVAYLVLVWYSVRELPFFSEDFTQLAWADAYTRVSQALSLANEPLRPFQHLYFYVLSHAGDARPALARLPAFAMHLASTWLVYVMARELGLSRGASLGASALFLAFPNVKSLVWGAAIGSPGRVVCALAAFDLYLVHSRSRGAATRAIALAACLVCFALALAFHESAVVFPVIALAHAIVIRGSGWKSTFASTRSALKHPLVLSLLAVALAYGLYLSFGRPARHHGLRAFDALPANVVKAATALAPEAVRRVCVEGLRGNLGQIGQVLAGAILLAIAGGAVYWLARGPKVMRFAVIAIAVDLALPVASTGFVQRYAYLSSAFLAVAIADAARRSRTPLAPVIAAAIGCMWFADSWKDVREYRRAGRVVDRVLLEARDERERAPAGTSIAIVDVPDMGGTEEDLPIFNWGLEEALARAKIEGPWLLWRTGPFHTSTSVVLVPRSRVEETVRTKSAIVLEYQPEAGVLERR